MIMKLMTKPQRGSCPKLAGLFIILSNQEFIAPSSKSEQKSCCGQDHKFMLSRSLYPPAPGKHRSNDQGGPTFAVLVEQCSNARRRQRTEIDEAPLPRNGA